jgi:hypothetical protein
VLLLIRQCKTESHTTEVEIQQPMDYFLWHWVSQILPHFHSGNKFLWPGKGLKEQNNSLTCRMFKIVVQSIFPWKDVTSYAIRTFHGTNSKNSKWAQAVFTSAQIQRRHYNITNEVQEFNQVIKEVNEESGFAAAMLQGLKEGASTDSTIVIDSTNLFAPETVTVVSVNKYRYEKNGQLSFLCSVSTLNSTTNLPEISEKIIFDRDLIRSMDLVNKFWVTVRTPERLPWEESPPKSQKRKQTETEDD